MPMDDRSPIDRTGYLAIFPDSMRPVSAGGYKADLAAANPDSAWAGMYNQRPPDYRIGNDEWGWIDQGPQQPQQSTGMPSAQTAAPSSPREPARLGFLPAVRDPRDPRPYFTRLHDYYRSRGMI